MVLDETFRPDLFKTGDGAFAIDHEQKITYWNRAAEELLGYPRGEALGQLCWQLLRGCTVDGLVVCRAGGDIISQATGGERVRHFELCVRHREGHLLLLTVSTIALFANDTNEPRGLLHLLHPVRRQPEWSGMLRIHLLGPVEVRRADGSTVDGPLWGRAKVRALFAFLALQERRPVERDVLLELLWPDLAYDAALRNLNTTTYNLRHSLEPDLNRGADSRYIYYESGSYWLGGAGNHWLDTRAFTGGLRRARAEPDIGRAIAAYESALALYRGGFVADLAGLPVWSEGEHHRFEDWFLAALEELGELYEQQGRHEEARNAYLKALSTAPWRETAAQRLMRLLMRLGDRAGAIRVCNRLKTALSRDLDIQPGPETRRLCQELRC